MPLLPLLLQSTSFSTPFLSTLLPSIGLAYTLQGLAAIPSILGRTEKYYDLSGSLTYLSCVGLSLALPVVRARAATAAHGVSGVGGLRGAGVGELGKLLNWRQVVLSAAVGIWATRCMLILSLVFFIEESFTPFSYLERMKEGTNEWIGILPPDMTSS